MISPTWQILEPGTWVIFGVIGMPVYGLLLGWFLGEPRNFKLNLMGFSYLVTFVVSLWGGLFAVTMLIGFLFFWPV